MHAQICKQCGKEFMCSSAAKICPECRSAKPRRKMIEIGNAYGDIRVDSLADRPYRRYKCSCLRCGEIFEADGATVFKYAETGCPSCRKKNDEENREEEYKKYIGNTFGNLKVVGYAGKKVVSKNNKYLKPFMICECLQCGSVSEIPLARLKSGQAKMCNGCAKTFLQQGKEIGKVANVGGTKITAIDGRRKTNKNSETGINGVSYHRQTGKYRAYINFCRKQYYLGVFDKIEDATAARETAETKIYGDFLKWYAETYPENWKKLNHKRNSLRVNWKKYAKFDKTSLSERQRYMLDAKIAGKTGREIADELGTTPHIVSSTLSRVKNKLDGRPDKNANRKYHNDAEYRKKFIERQKEYIKKQKENDKEKFNARMRENVKNYYHNHPEKHVYMEKCILKRFNKYQVTMGINGKTMQIGSFDNLEDAVMARDIIYVRKKDKGFSDWFKKFEESGKSFEFLKESYF